MRRHVDTTFEEGPKTGLDCEKFDFPADFRSVREGLGTCSGHLKAVTGDLDGRRLSLARRNAPAARPCNHCRIRPRLCENPGSQTARRKSFSISSV
jgi:hypothetical protein